MSLLGTDESFYRTVDTRFFAGFLHATTYVAQIVLFNISRKPLPEKILREGKRVGGERYSIFSQTVFLNGGARGFLAIMPASSDSEALRGILMQKQNNILETPVTRRSFLYASALIASASFAASPLSMAVADAVDDMEAFSWTACVINCGHRCPLRCFTKNGRVIRIETDNTIPDACDPHQLRACLKGRSMRQRIYSPDRLKYPMKRVGERGEGKFERISWEEALQTVADKLRHTIETYGNESVYWQYCSAQQSLVNSRRAWWRLLNLMGGYLKYYGSYSTAQISAAFPMTYGSSPASFQSEVANAKLYVGFGNNPSVTRGSGGGKSYQFGCALDKGRPKVVIIDPIFTDTTVGKADEWIPIRPGTDAALVQAIAYELIRNNWVDQAFLDKYCVGYDEKTLPASAPKKSDYKSFILGEGDDKTPKTPEWASAITGIPVETIVRLAREIGTTKPCFIAQGWGPQRQANGEETSRAIAMLPILTGNIGLPGTNTGQHEGNASFPAVYLPVGKNPVKATIPCFLWTDAIFRGKEMDAIHDGLKGVDKLGHDIKLIVNSGGNTLINQHGDSNWTDAILRDTSKCEFIVVCDNMMTPSARYADILLPDTLGPETDDIASSGGSNGDTCSLLPMHKCIEPEWEQRPSWEICRGIAKCLGLEEAFTEGKTQLEWVEWCYEETRKKVPELPPFAEFWKTGPKQAFDVPQTRVALADFRRDPAKSPLKTPSGKIEIYSERLAKIAAEWKLPEGDLISPIPRYFRTWEMPGVELSKKYPLQCYGYHGHGRIHSTFHNLPWLREQFPDHVLLNPIDAKARGIANDDLVHVFNDRGTVEIRAKVTPRIMPGVCSIPQGAWYTPKKKDGKTVDVGGNINTLTHHRPSPLAKGNAQHTVLVEIAKA